MAKNITSSGEDRVSDHFMMLMEDIEIAVEGDRQPAGLKEEDVLSYIDDVTELGENITTQSLTSLCIGLAGVYFAKNYLDQKPSVQIDDEQKLAAQLVTSAEGYSFFPADAETSPVGNDFEAAMVCRRGSKQISFLSQRRRVRGPLNSLTFIS